MTNFGAACDAIIKREIKAFNLSRTCHSVRALVQIPTSRITLPCHCHILL